MTHSTTTGALTVRGGGFPAPQPRSTTVTITDRHGDRVTVSTWNTCAGVGSFVAMLLGEPAARAKTMPRTTPPSCCRCDPARCASDGTGDHCVTAGCAFCVDGCPAGDATPCCLGGAL